MKIEELHQAYRAEPFKPFTMCLVDGRKVTVRHREFMAFSGNRTVLVGFPKGGSTHIDAGLIVSLDFDDEPAEPRAQAG